MQPLVSICCITYNHEKFIRQTLDSFIMQKTNFQFEILIHDDASTDKTQEIIKEYVEKYPDIIKPIYQTENQYSKGISVSKTFNFPRISAKYVAFCEGDDYWTDPNKLQKQVDFLEAHPDYTICFHPVKIIYEDKPNKTNIYPSINTLNENLTLEKLLKNNFIQTNSVMYRWSIKKEELNEKFPNDIIPGDWYINLLHAKEGKIGVLKEIMSVYRKHSGGVWFDTAAGSINLHRKHGLKELNFYYNVYKNISGCSENYLKNVLLPNFKNITDNFYNFGDIEKIAIIKNLYPEIFEKSLGIKNPIDKKLKKYKKLYIYFFIIAFILLILNLLQLIFGG